MSDLTVFVGTFNRTETLERCIRNLEAQTYPLKIVIVDNGSKDPAALALLDQLPYTVYRMPAIEDVLPIAGEDTAHGGHGMSAVQQNYSQAFRHEWLFGEAKWFAVCDCDTAPENPYSVTHYVDLAHALGVSVGPHLRLNVHVNYPLRTLALVQSARILFQKDMHWHDGIPYSFDDIDSTFHLFPATSEFDRLKMRTARVGHPYWTTHTDWLFDVMNPTPENHAYILESGEAASWSGNWLREFFRAWLFSPEAAYAYVDSHQSFRDDYVPERFILSWMLQYGHGCEVDIRRSRSVLRSSVPTWSPCWRYERHWDALVYRNNQSFLGW